MNVSAALRAVTNGAYLTIEEAEAVLGDIVEGETSPLQVAGLLCALRARGETPAELAGFARGLRFRQISVHAESSPLIDTCGTGGDTPRAGFGTFNVSTAAALIAAGAGAKIAKHGNRAVSSRSGSSDVLEALGVHLHLTPEALGRCIDEVGIAFLFAPHHHPALKSVGALRRELGVRTIFNLTAPLCNPAHAKRRVLGVPARRWLEPVAATLLELGCERAFVVHSEDGLDEFSTCAPTDFVEIRDGALHTGQFEPHSLAIGCLDPSLVKGGDPAENAVLIQQILRDGEGPSADLACLNAAAVLMVGDLADSWEDGLQLARASVNSGAALEKLDQLREFTGRYAN